MKNSLVSTQIRNLFFKSGLAEVFGIFPTDNLSKDPNHKTALLFGFLKEAAEGNLQNPNNILKWQKTGQRLLKK